MAPDKVKSEDAMTFGELLALIADQKRRLNVLEVAFSYLAFSLDDKANQRLIHSLKLESHSQNRKSISPIWPKSWKNVCMVHRHLPTRNNAPRCTHPLQHIQICRIIAQINIYFANFGDNPLHR